MTEGSQVPWSPLVIKSMVEPSGPRVFISLKVYLKKSISELMHMLAEVQVSQITQWAS